MPKTKTKIKRDIVTGRAGDCLFCGEHVREVQDPYSGCLDYETTKPSGAGSGDFGCSDSPETDEEGTGGHWPKIRIASLIRRLVPLENAIHGFTRHPAIGSIRAGTTNDA